MTEEDEIEDANILEKILVKVGDDDKAGSLGDNCERQWQ